MSLRHEEGNDELCWNEPRRGRGRAVDGGITGTFAALLMADVTIADMFVIGAGAGYGVFNNPRGPAIGFRAGVYPVHGVGADGIRRKGLVISFESRLAFLGDPNGTGVMLMGSIGYEAF